MKKLLLLVLISLLVFGCKKDEQKDNTPATQQEVSFSVSLVEPNTGLKDVPECLPLEPDYAWVQINGIDYYPQVFRIDGILYTQNIKLDVNPNGYTVNEFVLYDDGGTPGVMLPEADDQIVMATPTTGSHYAQYVTKAVNFPMDVIAFQKLEIQVEVLCFIPDVFTEFGFDWFEITEIEIREECFFGDICIKDVSATTGYGMTGSPYLNQGPIQLDMPALMTIYVKDASGNNVPYSPFTNAMADFDGEGHNWGVGAPLCINWPDNLQIPNEVFNVEIWIWVQDGDATGGFASLQFWTGTMSELGVLMDAAGNVVPAGDDGIIEVVLGECNFSTTDIQLVPYQNLPAAVDMYAQGAPFAPGDYGTYFDITLSGIVGVYDIHNGEYGVYCGDQGQDISIPGNYPNTAVYGSLDPASLPANFEQFFKDHLDNANWLMNNLENYPGYTWADIQNALWVILDEQATFPEPYVGTPTALSLQMSSDAMTYGNDYLPPPGGWAAVIFKAGDNIQVIFTFVDP